MADGEWRMADGERRKRKAYHEPRTTFLMHDFWTDCGYHLLKRAGDGRLTVTDDYLRAYYQRRELAPVEESCAAERALYAALMAEPRRQVEAREIAMIADADARENYRVMLRFRDKLLSAPTLEAFYFDLFRRDVAVPPDFIHHTVQVILRGLLDGVDDALQARAAELFFRPQRVTVKDGSVLAADDATVEMHATTGGIGGIGRLLQQAQVEAPVRTIELDVLDAGNSAEYWRRDSRYDTVLSLNPGRPGCAAFARVLERWIEHFHGTRVTITPAREIPDKEWMWHVGLDAEATAMLNEIYNGGEVEEERMKRIIGLFRADFADPSAVLPEVAGAPVFLGLATAADGRLRMKPQNLLINLPLARRA
jgi:hypothetical protein